MKKPNIVFVLTDQMRASAMGCAGVEEVYTPNIDGFANEGTRFTRAISNTPACSPARASLWSGMHTINHQLVNNDITLRTDFKSFAHSLNEQGYHSGYIGKWHLDNNDRGVFVPPGPRRQGFDDFWAAFNCNHLYFDGYYYLNDHPEPHWIDGYEPKAQTELAVDYIRRKVNEEQPFFLVLSWGPPHDPYLEVPRQYLDMYPEGQIRLKPNVPETASRQDIAGYYAHVTALDEYFGRILQAVSSSGIEESTIVVFTSDHGDMLYSQNEMYKSKPWSESINIPLIMRWPGHIVAGRVTGSPISIVDFMPTLLSMCQVTIPEQAEGVDLSAYVLGDETAGQKSVFINQPVVPKFFTHPEWRGVVTETHTYARTLEKPWILYNDTSDPHQLDNLLDSNDHAELMQNMEQLMQTWLQRIGDPFESTDQVVEKYYQGSQDGVMPHYENEKITEQIKKRREYRKKHGSVL